MRSAAGTFHLGFRIIFGRIIDVPVSLNKRHHAVSLAHAMCPIVMNVDVVSWLTPLCACVDSL